MTTIVKFKDILKKGQRLYRKYLKPRSWKHFFFVLALCAGGVLVIGGAVVLYYVFQVPDLSLLTLRRVNESTKIYDRTGEVILYDIHGEEKRTVIPWDSISKNVKNATLAAEDTEFYNHSGVDVKGIVRALYKDITTFSASQGGSTITQQFVKKALVGESKTLPRKIKEAILAIQIERNYTKDQIFWMYLNQIPYGANAYGIEAASQTYFGKSAAQLSIAEAAYLASIPKAPSYYSPYGSHLDQLEGRAEYVINRMHELGMITDTEYEQAKQESPKFADKIDHFLAPHFVIEVKKYLIKKYGEDLVENGGLKVVTTLDMNLQNIASSSVTKYGAINAKQYKANNAALVAMDPKTGQILAMVGSRDYWGIPTPAGCTPGKNCTFDPNTNVATSSIRQPGSSFKPFAYATAFGKGFPDSTYLFDVPIEFNPSCEPGGTQEYGSGACYHPKNYKGDFSGPVTMRQALGRSLNIPAVQTLYLAGIQDTVETARSMGISSLEVDSTYGLSLVLGGQGVSLVDMVNGYSVFANDGIHEPSTFILKITTGDGAILEEFKPQEERVITSQVARMISDVLSDNDARAPAFGFNSPLTLGGRPVAAKTGTTQKNRDGWLIGYTPSLAAGIWTGNNDDSSMTAAGAGVSAAGPMWNEFMKRALKDAPVEYFKRPSPSFADKTPLNGDYRGADGQIHSILYYVDPSDPLGPSPSNPMSDPQFKNWEYAVQVWVVANGLQGPPIASGSQGYETGTPPAF